MTTTMEEANAMLRAAIQTRREKQAAGAPLDDWYANQPKMPEAATEASCCEGQRFKGDSLLENRKHPSSVAHTRHGNGTTEKFGTGAIRSNTFEEFRYDLISPIGLREVARACAEGAEKYGDWNWERGMPVHDLLNHAIAHIYGFLSGDRSEPHLGHAAWNLLAAIHSHELWPRLNEGTLRSSNCGPPA